MTAGIAVVLAVAVGVESRAHGWAPPALGLAVSLALILRARLFTGLHQRIWLLFAGLVGLAAVGLRLVESAGGAAVAVALPVLGAAAVALGVALRRADRPYRPSWPRLGDLCELLVVATVIPIALQVLGVYGYARGLWG